jgi:hypothetical protein
LASVFDAHDVSLSVPEEYVDPAANQKSICKLCALSLSNCPVVSGGIVIVFFSHVFATSMVYDFEI